MGLSCDCFGYASASKRPVKRYNLLVPDIFPKNQPAVDQPVDASTQRQFKRLYEYLQKNPSRTPKASPLSVKAACWLAHAAGCTLG